MGRNRKMVVGVRRKSFEALLSVLSSEPVVVPLIIGAAAAAAAAAVLDLTVGAAHGTWLTKASALIAIVAALTAAVALRRRMRIVVEALDASMAPFVVYDEHDRLVISNARYREALQLPADYLVPGTAYEDIVRRTLCAWVPPDQLEFEVERRCALQRDANGIPTDRRYPDGVWMRVTKTRTSSGANVGIAVDVSELYTLKSRLQAEVQRFTALANSAPVGICQVSETRDVRFVNSVLLAMLDAQNPAELLAKPTIFVSGGRRCAGFGNLLAQLATEGCEHETEIRLIGEGRTLLVKQALVTLPQGDDGAANPEPARELILIFVDITDRKRAEEKISYLAMHDMLTGAGNRAAFVKAIEAAAEDVAETSPLTLIAIDLDRFKPINDTHGHSAGDEVLKQIAERIRVMLAPSMSLYRMGGDEFTIICRPDGMPDRESFAHAVLTKLEEPFEIGEHEISLSASIGLSVMPGDTDNAQTLLHYADLASYRAKHCGGGRLCLFHEELLDAIDSDRMLEFELKDAMERQTFEIVYQPQFAVGGGVPVGVEAFVRWRRKRSGALLKPAEFIAVARKLDLVDKLDRLVLQRAIAAYAVAMREPRCPHALSVNIAGPTLQRSDMADLIGEILARHGVPPARLVLELSELDAARLTDTVMETVCDLAERGVRFMLDEFGSGSASLRVLGRLPLSGVKVDCRFICNEASKDDSAEPSIQAITDMARSLGITAVATGVECEDGLGSLARLGYAVFQGHLLGPVGPHIPTDLFAAPIAMGAVTAGSPPRSDHAPHAVDVD